MDFSERYVRMCAAATELQAWWSKAPWQEDVQSCSGFGGKELLSSFQSNKELLSSFQSNIEVGDFFHHGKSTSRPNNPENQQVSIISNKILHVGSEIPAPFFSYEHVSEAYRTCPHPRSGAILEGRH